ncbi:methyltransferase [Flavisolibacter sp. BT320]|nr:methyltransferase [Flavisolibacter longurius]
MEFPLHLQTIPLQSAPVSLYVPDAAAVRAAYEEGKMPFPYWSQVWPAAIALAQFLAIHPEYIARKNIVELGAGLGLPSLVAASYAGTVLCTDIAPEAVAIVEKSVKKMGLENVCAMAIDWSNLPKEFSADVLILSDINYEPAAFGQLQKLVNRFLQNGSLILLSTPQRLMAKEFVLPLLQHYSFQEEISVEHNGSLVPTTVLVLEKGLPSETKQAQ